MKKQILTERFQQLAGIKPLYEQPLANVPAGTLTLDPKYDGGVGGMQNPPTAMAAAILNGEESAMINRFKDYIKQGTGKNWDAMPADIVKGFIQQYTNEVEPRAVDKGADTNAFFQALGLNPADTQVATTAVAFEPKKTSTQAGLANQFLATSKALRSADYQGLVAGEIDVLDDLINLLLLSAQSSNMTTVYQRVKALLQKSIQGDEIDPLNKI